MANLNSITKRSTEAFPFYRFSGTHFQIGEQYGEACKDLILKHHKYALEKLTNKVNIESLEALQKEALKYRPYVQEYAPFFDEEIQGIAKSTGLTLGDVYFLQLRAEIYNHFESTDECTTFAILPEATKNGNPLVGQNADLPEFYSEVSIVAEFVPDEGPSQLMLTPAGQVSYIGINNLGLGVFANFIVCEGWRIGFPRYLLSRLALTKTNVREAVDLIDGIYRASSRNLIMLDKTGDSIDLETVPERTSIIEPKNGLIAHSNHFIASELLNEERKVGEDLENSKVRLSRMRSLLENKHGQLNVEEMQEILRDRETAPHTLCRMPGDFGVDSVTFASVIAEPSKGKMHVTMGPPNHFEYKTYSFTK
ncbi:C45 family peptidase [Sporosarcina sp. ACRSL]|uniref:C45 family autoproteolytic acyltransferase/hydolase n=1 Tax=Sporosarcina sp. ACRSL TaxID=2918215 RepID=UPI001EF6F5A1|nr:C45 family peptidase [Sporosarcina sp. ACRSL]MCG7344056.1 C45 family peptidase [Sporosarcina sp. ACRSL]